MFRLPQALFILFPAALMALPGNPAAAQVKDPPQGSWPQWRGPAGTAVSMEAGWTTDFPTAGPKKVWEAKLGAGHSGPVVSRGRLYTLSTDPANPQMETVWCLDAQTGKQVWKHTYEVKSVTRGRTPAGSAPAVVGDVVFTCGAGLDVHALDAANGQILWHRDLMKDLPGKGAAYGFHGSPLPCDNLVIVPALTGPAGAKPKEPLAGAYAGTGGVLVALDQKTGKEVWRNTDGASAWSSPLLATIDGKPTVVHLTGHVVLGVNPADGKTLWKYDPKAAGLVASDMAASPLVQGDFIVAPIHAGPGAGGAGGGFKGGIKGAGTICLRIKDGKPELVWKNTRWGHWYQSAVLWDGYLYGYDERGTFACFDLKTGTEKWKTRELGSNGTGGGGFMLADGKVLAVDGEGQLIVAAVSPAGHKVLASAHVLRSATGFQFETAPLLLDGYLYCRNHTQLVCFDLRGKG
jgi:outer membrane protein assembly factor BamB